MSLRVITFKCPEEILEKIDQIWREAGFYSRTDFILTVVEEWIHEYRKKDPKVHKGASLGA